MAEATARPRDWPDGMLAADLPRPLVRRPRRWITRDIRPTMIRLTVPLCIILICGSFAAAALLQVRLDRDRALAQTGAFERSRAADSARVTGQTLDRYARLGAVFAASPDRGSGLIKVEPAIRDIAVWNADGTRQAHLRGASFAMPHLAGRRMVFAKPTPHGLAFRDQGRVIAVLFDPQSLAPAARGISLVPSSQARGPSAAVPGWPLAATVRSAQLGTPEDWAGTLPLHLFLILGPALAGGWLAALFVSSFERQARASRVLRAFKSTRPVEAKLMVRLANAERGAMEALRSKAEFIAHMSHELRTPLNAVIGFSEIIAAEFFGAHPKYSEYARDIGNAGKSLHMRISDILEFANIEAGHYPLTEEIVDLAALAGSCVQEQQGRAFSRHISLVLAVAEPGTVRADSRAVRRILSNLLANALAYTAEGGSVCVEVRFEEGAGVLTLSDSGRPHQADAAAGKPFERFGGASKATGAGLGLAIAMELARRMGGAMRLVGGGGGQGAIMELRLPRL